MTELAVVVFCLVCIVLMLTFKFKPKDSENIYGLVIAHRGFHMFAPENSIGAYEAAIEAGLAIELDIRQTRDKKIVCFHDAYTKRLLGVPGLLLMFNYDEINSYKLQESNYTIARFEDVLKLVNGKVELLVEIKGKLTKDFFHQLILLQDNYPKEMYFHTKSLIQYFKLKRVFGKTSTHGKRVYYILNPFRKRFNFVKGKDYINQRNKYNEMASSREIEIPSIEDISNIIVRSIEELESKKEILATIGSVLNGYESRVKLNDLSSFIYNSVWLHRGIISQNYLEHSKDSFIACREYAKTNNIRITVELDVMLYKGEVRCYHKDKISSILGQEKSCAEKEKIEKSMTLKNVLRIFRNSKNVSLALDIKDYHIKNRVLEDLIILDIEKCKYSGNFIVMSYNPLVLTYFKKNRPNWLRAQIGHSLEGLRRIPIFRFPTLLNSMVGLLFDMSCADCVVFDNSKWIYYLIVYHKSIKGKPVLIYAPKTYMEQQAFIGRESVANFIVENIADTTAWPEEYLQKFKISETIKTAKIIKCNKRKRPEKK